MPAAAAAGLFLWGLGLVGRADHRGPQGNRGKRFPWGGEERRGEGYGARDDEAPHTDCPCQPRHGRHVLFAELLRFYFKAIPRICGHSCF